MSEIKHASVWLPPPFPLEGCLPRRVQQVQQNIKAQRDAFYAKVDEVNHASV